MCCNHAGRQVEKGERGEQMWTGWTGLKRCKWCRCAAILHLSKANWVRVSSNVWMYVRFTFATLAVVLCVVSLKQGMDDYVGWRSMKWIQSRCCFQSEASCQNFKILARSRPCLVGGCWHCPKHHPKPRRCDANHGDDWMLSQASCLSINQAASTGPPNSSDEHISCTAPATENASLQILFNCPTPAIVFGNATKSPRFAHFWQRAQSLAPATQNDSERPKVLRTPLVFCDFDFEMCFAPQRRAGPKLRCFIHFDFEMCFAPQRRTFFRHLNF